MTTNSLKIIPSDLIDERDRKLTATELQLCPSSSVKSPLQAKSPRVKFLKQDSTDAHSLCPRQPTSHRPGSVSMFVTVQEPLSLKDWSAGTKGDKHDRFKSPALFWEIRLKESQVSSEKACRPTAQQIIALCEVLAEYAERATAQGDLLFNAVKEQIFSAIFADYSAKNLAEYASNTDLLRDCVPYPIIAERIQADKVLLERKVENLEKAALQPSERSFRSSCIQTDEAELDVNSGAIALQRKILDLMYQVEEYETENFNSMLERQEMDSKTGHMVETQQEQIIRLTELSTRMRKQCEIEKECSELYRHQVLKLQEENRQLIAETKAMAKDQISLRFSYDKKLAFIGETLKAERQRFTRERADWLESFVSERYDLFNSMVVEPTNDDEDQNDDTDLDNVTRKDSFHGVGILNRNSSKSIGEKHLLSDNAKDKVSFESDGRLERKQSMAGGDRRRTSLVPDERRVRRMSSVVHSDKKRNSILPDEDSDINAEKRRSQKPTAHSTGENFRFDLWNSLTELGKASATQLDSLYSDKSKMDSDREHRQCIRDILKRQELAMQQILLTSPALHDWKFISSDPIK